MRIISQNGNVDFDYANAILEVKDNEIYLVGYGVVATYIDKSHAQKVLADLRNINMIFEIDKVVASSLVCDAHTLNRSGKVSVRSELLAKQTYQLPNIDDYEDMYNYEKDIEIRRKPCKSI